jgi:DNA-directed RNA polymerase specialized sigma24 family protein
MPSCHDSSHPDSCRRRPIEPQQQGTGLELAEYLVRSHWAELVSCAQINLGGDSAFAEDLAASTIARFAFGAFESRSVRYQQALGFAKAVIRNDARHAIRRANRLVPISDETPTGVQNPEPESISNILLRKDLTTALTALTSGERAVLELHYNPRV